MASGNSSLEMEARYRAALAEYLSKGDEGPLSQAYELGRQALNTGMSLLDIAAMYHRVLFTVLGGLHGPHPMERRPGAAERFIVETLSPFEMMHRSHIEANAALLQLNEAKEDQARRIAHELHDEASQLLATVHLELADAARQLPDGGAPYIGRVRTHLEQTREHLRGIAHELRPPMLDDLGLVPALRILAEHVSHRSGVAVVVHGHTMGRLDGAVETAVYRIAQEGLANVIQHAQATQAWIEVHRDTKGLRFSLRDNGVGFDDAERTSRRGGPGLGLIGVRARLAPLQGSLRIQSQPSHGTELVVTIPID